MYEYKRAGTTHPAITTKYFVCFRETFTSLIFKTSLPSPDIQTGNQTFKFGGLMFVLAFQSDDLQFISRNGFRERLEIFSKRVQDLDKCLGMDDALFLKYLNEKKAKVYHHLYKEIYVYFFFFLFRFRVLYRQTGSPIPITEDELVTKYIYHYFCCWRTDREKALRRMMAYAVQTEMPVITQEIG